MENITASYLTLCGSTFGEPPRHKIFERSQAAFDHGFAGIGVCDHELSRMTVTQMRQVAAWMPCPVTELEWFDLARPDKHCASTLFAAADAFGARRVNVGICHGDFSFGKVVRTLRGFAGQAATHGLDVAVEPVAFGPMWSPIQVMDLIREVDQPNVGLLFDTWHMNYALNDSQVSFMPDWPKVAEVQLAGAWHNGHSRKAAMQRCLPGHWQDSSGAASWYRLFRQHAPQVPISIEVTNGALRTNELGVTAAYAMSSLNQISVVESGRG